MPVNYTIEHMPVEQPANSSVSSQDSNEFVVKARLNPKDGFSVAAGDFTIEGNLADNAQEMFGYSDWIISDLEGENGNGYTFEWGPDSWTGDGLIRIMDTQDPHSEENYLMIEWYPAWGGAFFSWEQQDIQLVLDIDGDAKEITPTAQGYPDSFFLHISLRGASNEVTYDTQQSQVDAIQENPHCSIWPMVEQGIWASPINGTEPVGSSYTDFVNVIDGGPNGDPHKVILRFNLQALTAPGNIFSGNVLEKLNYIKFVIVPDDGYVVSRHNFHFRDRFGGFGGTGSLYFADDQEVTLWNWPGQCYGCGSSIIDTIGQFGTDCNNDGVEVPSTGFSNCWCAMGSFPYTPILVDYNQSFVNYTNATPVEVIWPNNNPLTGELMQTPYLDPLCYCVNSPYDYARQFGCGSEPLIGISDPDPDGEGITDFGENFGTALFNNYGAGVSQVQLPLTGQTVPESTDWYPATTWTPVRFEVKEQTTHSGPGPSIGNFLPGYNAGEGFEGGCNSAANPYSPFGLNQQQITYTDRYLDCSGPFARRIILLDSIMQSQLPALGGCSKFQVEQELQDSWDSWCGNRVRISLNSILAGWDPYSNMQILQYSNQPANPLSLELPIYGKAMPFNCNQDGDVSVDLEAEIETDFID